MSDRTVIDEGDYFRSPGMSLRMRAHNWLIRRVVGRRPVVMNVRLTPCYESFAASIPDNTRGLILHNCELGGVTIKNVRGAP